MVSHFKKRYKKKIFGGISRFLSYKFPPINHEVEIAAPKFKGHNSPHNCVRMGSKLVPDGILAIALDLSHRITARALDHALGQTNQLYLDRLFFCY